MNDEVLTFIKGDPTMQNTFGQYAVQMNFLTTGQTDMTYNDVNTMLSENSKTGGSVILKASAFQDFNDEVGKLCSQVPCNYKLLAALKALNEKIKLQGKGA